MSKQTAVISASRLQINQCVLWGFENAFKGDQHKFGCVKLKDERVTEDSLCYPSLRLPLELLPVDPARVRLPLESPESFRVRVPTCSFELALLTVLQRAKMDRDTKK